MPVCPRCLGRGQLGGIACGRDAHGRSQSTAFVVPCSICDSTGVVDDAEIVLYETRQEVGRALRQRRRDLGQDMRAVAASFGLSVSDYSAIEMGRVDATPEILSIAFDSEIDA